MPEPELPTSPATEPPRVEDLQFERAQFTPKTCASCQSLIADSYYTVGGATVCPTCMSLRQVEQAPARPGAFLRAALYGLGGGLAGSVVYAIVLHMGFVIGVVSILVGWLVGKGVQRATGGRGGRRYQILALALTYGCITISYMPSLIQEIMKTPEKAEQPTPQPEPAVSASQAAGGLALGLVALAGICAVLPFAMLFDSPFNGAINLLIILFGLQQAWKLTARSDAVVEGPFPVQNGA